MDPNQALRNVTGAMRSGRLDNDAMASYDGYVEWSGNGGFLADDDVRGDFAAARLDWDSSNGEGAFQDAYRSYLTEDQDGGG